MEPAITIIKKLGGPTKVSLIAGVHRTRVYGWMKAREKGGTGGAIPLAHIPRLLDAATEQGICLSWEDFRPAMQGAA